MAEERAFVVLVEGVIDEEKATAISEAIKQAVAPLVPGQGNDDSDRRRLEAPMRPLEEIIGAGNQISKELRDRLGAIPMMGIFYRLPGQRGGR